jgi:3-dehydroquinate dehydratase/shikimate dehydrogenase
MLLVSIPSQKMAEELLQSPQPTELRLDLFASINFNWIASFLEGNPHPTLLTLRKSSQGGKFFGTEEERETLIEKLLSLDPPFFDLESDMRPEFLHKTIQSHPKTQFILSYHNFEKTPDDLEEIYLAMRRYRAFTYKIAAMTQSTNDALKMLLFGKNHPDVSVICMGEKGSFARVLSKVLGNRINYASLSQEVIAPGQISVQDLTDIYHYPFLNQETAIYGLIGSPVEKSPGHLYHNNVFFQQKQNRVYVKMEVHQEELAQFISLARAVPIQGLSVTIPLKEKIIPFLDKIEPHSQKIGAINTVRLTEGEFIGTNTDGLGALDAIEKKLSVLGKTVVLLGAGGAARAIAFEAKRRGARVIVLNRTVERAKELGFEAGGLDEVPANYDILINCSPYPMPIHPHQIKQSTLVMDVVYFPKETEFLKIASSKNCQIVYGEEMFFNQAARQSAFWGLHQGERIKKINPERYGPSYKADYYL